MRKFTRRGDSDGLVGQRSPNAVPEVFVAVAEALAAGTDPAVACDIAGRTLANNGADLGEALDGLSQVCQRAVGRGPSDSEIRALSVAWSEETLGYLHQISCEDPLTGVSSLSHVRARLAEVYRGEERRGNSASVTHALVVIEELGEDSEDQNFERALNLSRLADTVRIVFQGSETIGRVGNKRLIVLAKRRVALGKQVALLERLIRERMVGSSCRVWIEGLPSNDHAAARVLDELARD